MDRAQITKLATEAAVKHGLDPRWFIAQLAQESGNFAPDVLSGKRKSSAGAVGIAQFMPATARRFGVDPLNVPQAIDGAARYMALLKQQFGSEELARQAYNWGEGNLAKHLQDPKARPMPAETRDYNMHIAKRLPPGPNDDLQIPVLGQTPRTQVARMLSPPAAAAGFAGLFSAPSRPLPGAIPGGSPGLGAPPVPPPKPIAAADAAPPAPDLFAALGPATMGDGLRDILSRATELQGPLLPAPSPIPDRFDGMIKQLLRSV